MLDILYYNTPEVKPECLNMELKRRTCVAMFFPKPSSRCIFGMDNPLFDPAIDGDGFRGTVANTGLNPGLPRKKWPGISK
jgi:hypothetical protein